MFWIFFYCLEILQIKAVKRVKEFSCKTRIISGSGACNVLKELNSQRLFVVTDPFFEENGTAAEIAAYSSAPEIKRYSAVAPDPTVEQVARGTAALKSFAPDTVVALGGGSTLDCAKAMVFFSGLNVTFVAIPTTSGSGSEVTDFAIVTYGGVKHPIIDEKLRPNLAILDSNLLQKLPPRLIADTGFDVLAHALEACVAVNGGAISKALAAEAFASAWQALPRSYQGQTAVRLQMHEASCMAAMAFNSAGLGLCHAMAHAMGGLLHLPHGRLNAILLPGVVGVNQSAAGEKYAVVARSAGLGGAAEMIAVRNLKNRLIALRRELDLPATLEQAGVSRRQVMGLTDKIVQATLADPCCATNPVAVTEDLVRQLLKEVTA